MSILDRNNDLKFANPEKRLTANMHPLIACGLISSGAALFSNFAIPRAAPLFGRAGLSGKDLSKIGKPEISESMGAVSGLIYLIAMYCLLPFAFLSWMHQNSLVTSSTLNEFTCFLSALLSIQSMLFLGFADDVLNLKWRHKLFLPAIAAIPLLFVYGIESGETHVVLPSILRGVFKTKSLELGVLYYVYICSTVVFCTNSINILAGINGIEAGQSVVIAVFCTLNSAFQYIQSPHASTRNVHLITLYLLLPFIGVTISLLKWNWYPARVFVGDTFTYFAGMVLAVSSILGHFSKTMLLLHSLQIFNFLFSAPQLFFVLPCPRHRLPKFEEDSNLLVPSEASIKQSKLKTVSKLTLKLASCLGMCRVIYPACTDPDALVTFTNFTVINSTLLFAQRLGYKGLHEKHLCIVILSIQSMMCLLGLLVKNYLAAFFYT